MDLNIQPLNKSKRSGDWRETPARTQPIGQKRPARPAAVFGKGRESDTSSFSEMMQRALSRTAQPEDELQALIHAMNGGNDRIRNIALSLTSPVPKTDAMLDAAISRARVVPYAR